MSEDKYFDAIEQAKEFLEKNKRDSMHDIHHVDAVWKNCQTLIENEQLTVKSELLKVATYWHDVVVDSIKWPSKLMVVDTCKYLSHILPKIGFSETEITTTLAIIERHEFRDTPKNVEGLVLQDADKIDATSVERGIRMLEDYRNGNTTKETLVAYMKTYLKWISILDATFYFPYSREKVRENIEQFWKTPRWKGMAAELGLEKEYQESKQRRSSVKVWAMRAFLRVKGEVVKQRVLHLRNY